MKIRRSLIWYIVGLIVLVLVLSSLTYFYIAKLNQRNTLTTYEVSRDKDVRFVVQSLIDDEVERLEALALSLRQREDLIIDLAVTNAFDEYIGSLQHTMDSLAKDLSLTVFEAADPEGIILYSVSDPSARGMNVDYALPKYQQDDVHTELALTEEGWSIRAIIPAMVGNVRGGYMMIGTVLNDTFISRIAWITETDLTLGSSQGMASSSLPDNNRSHIDLKNMRRALKLSQIQYAHKAGTNIVVTYGPVRVLDRQLALVVEFDTSELVEINQQQMRKHLLVFGTSIVIALFLSIALALRMVYPLITLRKRAETTVHEIAGKETEDSEGDEIQSLVHSFDFMVSNIKEHLAERKQMEASLRMAKQDWENTFNSITDMITIHDMDFNIIASNTSAEKLLNIDFMAENMPKCFQIYHGTDAPPSGCPSCESTKTKKPCIHEIYEPHLDMFLEIRAIPRLDADNNITGLIHVVRDISKRKELENELTRQALYDSLTDLPNRALFNDRLKNLFGHKERNENLLFAVLFIDLDHFKRINDTLGHVFGDKLLVAVAERLRSCVRPGDTVSRFGGDEFVIILDELNSKDEAMAVNERIHYTLGSPIIIGGSEIFITASVGIAFNSPDYKLPEHIVRDADNAMYHAKVRGRAQHAVFDEGMRFSTMKTMTLENDLRRAVDRREFKLHYQPIINLATGAVSGFEALLRWNHPTEGMVLPDMFIPAAEETGLIVPLGDWVIETACTQISHWQNSFPKKPALTVSVNIAGKQFDETLPGKVERALKNSNLDPESLTLEITESTLMENSKLATEVMTTLHDMGVYVYLDDFGTGYSSLRYIHTFPVKALKIDRSFVRNISEDREAREIVRAIASLAKNLEMVLIVEGVEDIKHLEIFRALQCQYAQGFLFSRPLAPADIETYMEKHSSAAL